jgi:uncharacterized protein (TIGR02145 family)
MNKLYIIAVFLISFTGINAQVTYMVHHYNSGTTDTFAVADIDSITFFTTSNSGACPTTMTDLRDNEVYCIVTIGTQTWMAENLRYNASGSWLNPANPSTTYGRSYDWATVMNGSSTSSSNPSGVQGICPSGWHLPSDSEWNEMEMALGMPAADTANTGWRGTDHGTKMKSTTGWISGNGTNASGFNAFPAGGYGSVSFYGLGGYAYFWSSTEGSGSGAWNRSLDSGSATVFRYDNGKANGFSCRCVEN